MIILNSRLFHSVGIFAFILSGCNPVDKPASNHKYQAVVILDKTSSVSYTGKLPGIQQELTRNLCRIYDGATKDIRCSRLIITGSTNVFPDINRFKDFTFAKGGSRRSEEARQQWENEKRKWIFDEVKQDVTLIDSPCTSNRTDIFSIFSGIRQVQTNDSPWDSTNVFIFSDMVNTTSFINMNSKELTIDNAFGKGKSICQHLIDRGEITAGNLENLVLTIYTPNNMEKTAQVYQFWKGFFAQWGLGEDHYHFE